MDPEEERIQYLSRVGREKIFKHGTYTVVKERPITQDHPFYAVRQPVEEARPEPAAAPAAEPASEPDAAALAGQILSSNFKVGLSQEEVDALLNGM
ncbi:MAG: hypothetical protein J5910_05340 [Lachnospiraceae bacterium]|nr:hypothetical protein [Lachnospiraceae bacterium]